MKVAFLDRDGTINRDYPDDIWSQIQYPEILPGAIQGMKCLKEKGYEIIIVTNQYIIGERIISIEQYYEFNSKLLALLIENDISIMDVFYCPHARTEQCDCCKPRNGLIKHAIRKYP
ncbi:MAG: HAD-IIIA family hydrolase, partial [Ruminococcus sp.]|nr:HAD-IIIA family hydrolase [Ruminococcus sp.]